MLTARDTGEGSILTLLDFSLAFDTVDIRLLPTELVFYGFDCDTVNWFSSYLNGVALRRLGLLFFLVPPSLHEGFLKVSILELVLFIFYTTGILDSVWNCRCHLYADSLQIYISFNQVVTQSTIS